MAKTKAFKTEAVTEILREIGALVDKPEKGWRARVEELLAERKMKVNPVTIYQTRNTLMGRGTRKDRKKAEQRTEKNGQNGHKQPNITINDIRDIRDLSDRFGGLDGLGQAIREIQTLFPA